MSPRCLKKHPDRKKTQDTKKGKFYTRNLSSFLCPGTPAKGGAGGIASPTNSSCPSCKMPFDRYQHFPFTKVPKMGLIFPQNTMSTCFMSISTCFRSRKRRLTDSCGHERCFSCIFRNDLCPICHNSGKCTQSYSKLPGEPYFELPPESSQAKVSRLISKNPPLPSCEMSIKLRRSRTEDGLLSSRKEKCQLLTLRDESRDSAFFSLNNTSLCLSPELRRPEESSSVYQQQVTNDLPKPLYLEVCSTTVVDNLIAFLTT